MASPAIDPRDSAFSAGLAALLGQVQGQRNTLTTQGQRGDEDFATYLQRLAASRAKALQSTTVGANKQGLFYSGILGKQLGDVNTDFGNQQSDQTLAHLRQGQDIRSQLDQVGNITADPNSPYGYSATGGAGQSLSGLLSDAAARRVNTLQSDPVDVPAAAPATPDAPAPPAATPAAKASNVFTQTTGPHAGKQYKLIQKGGKNYRDYGDGTPPVYVGPST